MKRGLGLALLGWALAACMAVQSPPSEHELFIETLTLGEVHASPPRIVATLTGYTGVCERLEVRQKLVARTFQLRVIGIYEASAEPCPDIAKPNRQTAALELEGLAAGVYTVRAGSHAQTFTVPALATGEALVESVAITLLESNPVQVIVTAEGYLSSGCEKIGNTKQRLEQRTFVVTISTEAPWGVACPPIAPPFSERLRLETQNLRPGPYNVMINGASASFDML